LRQTLAFDLWVHRWRLTKTSGHMIVIRYADDTIVGFAHEHEARPFLDELKERMRQFKLALHPDKTQLIRFGRHAAKQREELGEGKPETFDFLGFTHFCTRSRKWGTFVIGRKTNKKRMQAKMQAIKIELRKKMHDPIAKTEVRMKQMLQGHLAGWSDRQDLHIGRSALSALRAANGNGNRGQNMARHGGRTPGYYRIFEDTLNFCLCHAQ
jgi:hypothetical protein